MREASALEVAALCFSHRYRRVGWDLTRLMSPEDEVAERLDCPPDEEYPRKLWGESVVHSFRRLLGRLPIPDKEVEDLADWQLAEPNAAPIRLLAPEAVEIYKILYPEDSPAQESLRALQVKPPAMPNPPLAPSPELVEFVDRHSSILWRAQQSFSLLFFNFLLHHDVVGLSDLKAD